MQPLNRTPSWILSALSGLFLILIFPQYNLEFLAWFALIPLFFAIQNQPPKTVASRSFFTGMIFYFFGLNWITNTLVNYGNISVSLSYLILALLAAYLSFYIFFILCTYSQVVSCKACLLFFTSTANVDLPRIPSFHTHDFWFFMDGTGLFPVFKL